MNQQDVEAFLAKAEESLRTAEGAFAARQYNSCANRCYYACFQAALAALGEAGIDPRGQSDRWSHGKVHSAFAGQLINRQKRFSSQLADTLPGLADLRQTADYEPEFVTGKLAGRALRRCRAFVDAVRLGINR